MQEEQDEESLETRSVGGRGGEKLDVEEDDELDEDEGYLYRLGNLSGEAATSAEDWQP